MTVTPLTVRTDKFADPDRAGELNAALASLPMTYHHVGSTAETADVVAVSGPEWVAQAKSSVSSGVRGILAIDPYPSDTESVRELASLSCPVVIDTRWRHNPAVDLIRDGITGLRKPGALLEVHSTTTPGDDLAHAALGLLDLVTAVATDLSDLWTLRHDDRHLVLGGRFTDQTALVMTLVSTNAQPSYASLSMSGSEGRAQLRLPDPATAASATATLTGPAGHTMLPVGNESARRGALKRLAAVLADDTPPQDDLARFGSYTQLLLEAVERETVPAMNRQTSRSRGAI